MNVLKFIVCFIIASVSFLFVWLLEGFISLPLVKLFGFETMTYTIFFFVLLILGLVITIVYCLYWKKSNKEWKGTHLIYVMAALFGAILGNFPNLSEGKELPYNHISYYKRFDERAIIKYGHFNSRTEDDYSYGKGLATVSGDVLIPGRIVGDPYDDYYFGSFIDNESGNQLYFAEYKKCLDNKTIISIFENGKLKCQYEFYEEEEDIGSGLSRSERESIFRKIFNVNIGTLLHVEEGGGVMGNILDWDVHYFE